MSGVTEDRCRWHDPNGRCADPLAFPGVPEVPELCMRHLHGLEAWVRLRVAACKADGKEWAVWAARKAESADDELKALGVVRAPRGPLDRPLQRARPPERR